MSFVPRGGKKTKETLPEQNYQRIANITAKITEEKQKIIDFLPSPDNGYTAGAGNVFFSLASVRFGQSSYNVSFLRKSFTIPSDYKLGTDIYIKFWAYSNLINNIDCILYAYCKGATDTIAWEVSGSTTSHSPDALSATSLTLMTITLPDSTLSFVVGDLVSLAFSMADNGGIQVIDTYGYYLEYTSKIMD